MTVRQYLAAGLFMLGTLVGTNVALADLEAVEPWNHDIGLGSVQQCKDGDCMDDSGIFNGTLGYDAVREMNTCFSPAKDCHISIVIEGERNFDKKAIKGTYSFSWETLEDRCAGAATDCYGVIMWPKKK